MRKLIVGAMLLAMASGAAYADQDKNDGEQKERLICKRQANTESRMGSKKICHTEEEWKKIQAAGGDASLLKNGGQGVRGTGG